MFHRIPKTMQQQMAVLEARDTLDREDGTPRKERLRQVPPDTGKFLALTAANAPEGEVVETAPARAIPACG